MRFLRDVRVGDAMYRSPTKTFGRVMRFLRDVRGGRDVSQPDKNLRTGNAFFA